MGAVGAWVWLDRRSARELDAERETMLRAGLLVPLDELMPKPPAPDDNAAPLYEKATAAHEALPNGPGHPDSTGFSGYADGEPAALDDPLLLGTRGGSGRPMPARRVEQVLAASQLLLTCREPGTGTEVHGRTEEGGGCGDRVEEEGETPERAPV